MLKATPARCEPHWISSDNSPLSEASLRCLLLEALPDQRAKSFRAGQVASASGSCHRATICEFLNAVQAKRGLMRRRVRPELASHARFGHQFGNGEGRWPTHSVRRKDLQAGFLCSFLSFMHLHQRARIVGVRKDRQSLEPGKKLADHLEPFARNVCVFRSTSQSRCRRGGPVC